MKLYQLQRQGNLLILRAAVGAPDGSVIVLRLLLDTGASYTMPPSTFIDGLLGMDFLSHFRATIVVDRAEVGLGLPRFPEPLGPDC